MILRALFLHFIQEFYRKTTYFSAKIVVFIETAGLKFLTICKLFIYQIIGTGVVKYGISADISVKSKRRTTYKLNQVLYCPIRMAKIHSLDILIRRIRTQFQLVLHSTQAELEVYLSVLLKPNNAHKLFQMMLLQDRNISLYYFKRKYGPY